jgi:hypothetical protein
MLGESIDGLLDRLYARNHAQDESLGAYFSARAAEGNMDWNNFDARTNEFLKDKLVALDRSKAEFCYHLCRALRARRIVEAGTSFGVSTLFLASAVRDNLLWRPIGQLTAPPRRRSSPLRTNRRRRARPGVISRKLDWQMSSTCVKAIFGRRSSTCVDRSTSCSSTSGRRWPGQRSR